MPGNENSKYPSRREGVCIACKWWSFVSSSRALITLAVSSTARRAVRDRESLCKMSNIGWNLLKLLKRAVDDACSSAGSPEDLVSATTGIVNQVSKHGLPSLSGGVNEALELGA